MWMNDAIFHLRIWSHRIIFHSCCFHVSFLYNFYLQTILFIAKLLTPLMKHLVYRTWEPKRNPLIWIFLFHCSYPCNSYIYILYAIKIYFQMNSVQNTVQQCVTKIFYGSTGWCVHLDQFSKRTMKILPKFKEWIILFALLVFNQWHIEH